MVRKRRRGMWLEREGEECARKREGRKRVREGPRLGVCSVCSPVDSAPGTRLQATSICRIPSILSLSASIATVLPTDPRPSPFSTLHPFSPKVHPAAIAAVAAAAAVVTLGLDTTFPTTTLFHRISVRTLPYRALPVSLDSRNRNRS